MDFNNFGADGFSGFKNASQGFNIKKPKHIKLWIALAIVILAIIAVIRPLVSFLLEYWQLKEINPEYTSVFFTNIWAKILTTTGGFVIFFIIFFINIMILRQVAIRKYFNVSFLNKKWPYVVLCFALSLLAGRIAGDDLYVKLLSALNGESFGISDALFSRDIGYYIFVRPFLTSIIGGVKAVLILQIIALGVIYYLVFAKNGYKNLKEIVQTQMGAVVHILVNVIIYFILIMLSYRFTAENLLYQQFGSGVAGAGFIETNIFANYYKIAPFIILAVIVFASLFLYRKKYVKAIIFVAIVPALSILVNIAAIAVDSLVVSPNERNVQSEYIEKNIEATLNGFNLNEVKDVEYEISNNITMADVTDNSTEIDNIRITDFRASLTAYNQLQYFRKYYKFNDIDVVPYEIDGELNAIFMSAREMNKETYNTNQAMTPEDYQGANQAVQSYANRMFRYTHGFGVVASPINEVTEEGQPEFIVRDIPPVVKEGLPQIAQPRIYYGELTNDYVIVGGDNKELDYSEGVTDIEYTFDGETGIQMTPIKRALFSAYYGDYRMLFSSNISSDSKLLVNRNIMKRVEMAAPFLTYDADPYIIIADDGTLKWIIDAYTTSSYYPYAQRYNGINYIRNSIKVIIDAYTGDMKFYVIDENDPIAKTYRNIYPKLFANGPLPEEVVNHITVPEYMFKLQREVYETYHVEDAGQFYDKADVWSVATEKYENSDIEVEPYFNVMKIEPNGKEELVLTTPFVLQGKYNMVGFLMMRTEKDHYGEMILYRMPKNETVYGTMQIENRIDNDPEISREMTLWNSGGSTVIRGNLLVVPFKNSILYVEPVYISTQNQSSLPELKRIIVAYKDGIAMEETLVESLSKVIGTDVPSVDVSPEIPDTPQIESQDIADAKDAIEKVLDSYESFRKATKDNDWTKMG
ncbi:MAG: UPF0182 family protein, partial [Clostridia bacterium]|nr:UPF0182 family protein [Clostridia bacterium]